MVMVGGVVIVVMVIDDACSWDRLYLSLSVTSMGRGHVGMEGTNRVDGAAEKNITLALDYLADATADGSRRLRTELRPGR